MCPDLKQANDDISVHGCKRLGKFNSSGTRPKPLLIKLSYVFDVDAVLCTDLKFQMAFKLNLT